jgi:DNA-binding NtrC family response regulator
MGTERRPRVLVIDGDAAMRETLVSMLDCAGFEGASAADADEGLAALQAHPFEVALCDVHLPRRDGFSFVRAAHRVHPSAPVVLMSSFGCDDTRADAVAAGAAGLIAKPFSIRQLCDALGAALAAKADLSAPS